MLDRVWERGSERARLQRMSSLNSFYCALAWVGIIYTSRWSNHRIAVMT